MFAYLVIIESDRIVNRIIARECALVWVKKGMYVCVYVCYDVLIYVVSWEERLII